MQQSFVLLETEISIEKIIFFPDRTIHIVLRVCPLNEKSTWCRLIMKESIYDYINQIKYVSKKKPTFGKRHSRCT